MNAARGAPTDVERLLDRIRGEFLEMPGLKLTKAQARRLWGLDEVGCDVVLSRLTDERFLKRMADEYHHPCRSMTITLLAPAILVIDSQSVSVSWEHAGGSTLDSY